MMVTVMGKGVVWVAAPWMKRTPWLWQCPVCDWFMVGAPEEAVAVFEARKHEATVHLAGGPGGTSLTGEGLTGPGS